MSTNSRSRSRSRSNSPAPRGGRSQSPVRRDRSPSPRRRLSPRSASRSRSRTPPRRDRRSPERERGERQYEPAPPSRIIGVFGLSANTREADLEDLLSPYGRLESVKLIVDKNTGESKRFGFAYYEQESDASKAREELNGTELHGRKLRIDYSLTSGAHPPTPGRYLGKNTSRDRGRYDDRRDYRRDDYRRDDRRYDDRRYDDRRYDDRRDDRRYDDRRYDDRRDDRRYDDRRDERRYDDRR